MKINRKITQISILAIMVINIMVVYGFQPVKAQESGDISDVSPSVRINTNIVSIKPSYLEVGGKKNDLLSTGGIYTISGSGGQIKVVRSPNVYLNEDEVKMSYINTETDESGNQIAIFRGVIPVEFDYNIYTIFSSTNMNPYHKTLEVSSDEESKVCVGRIWIGDSTDDDDFWDAYDNAMQDDNGWAYAHFDVPAGQACYHTADKDWKYRSDTFPSTTHVVSGNWKDQVGNDGRKNFCSKEATKRFFSNAPYLKLGDPTVDGGNIEALKYGTQTSKILEYASSSQVDIGTFNVGWDLNIQAIRGIRETIKLNDKGTAKLTVKNTYVHLTDAYTLSGGESEDRKGLISETSEASSIVPNAPKDSETTLTKQDTNTPIYDSKASGGASVTVSNPKPLTSTIGEGSLSSYFCDTPASDLGLWSKDLNKDYDSFSDTESSNVFNYTQWDVQFKGFRLSPRVVTKCKTTTVNYVGAWLDYDKNSIHNDKPESSTDDIKLLAGLVVQNSFIHQRVRVNLEVYSRYNIYLEQPSDAKDLSKLNDPTSPYVNDQIDTDDYGTTGFDYTQSAQQDWFDKWLDDLFGGLGGYTWVIWVILAIVGLVIVIYVVRSIGKFLPSASGGYPQYAPPMQPAYSPQLAQQQMMQQQLAQQYAQQSQAMQQQNAQLMAVINQLQQELAMVKQPQQTTMYRPYP